MPPVVLNGLRKGRSRLLFYRDRLFAVDKSAFRRALQELGVPTGELVYVRSSYNDMRSIQASPLELIEILCEVAGNSGTLVMPTYPMSGRSQDYLDQHSSFDWRRTPSQSGLLTEIFRRMPDTERSIHPTHPLAARGPAAKWLTEGHEHSKTPFDEHSPYQKLVQKNALVLSIGRFDTIALHHLADHIIQDKIPYPIYSDRAVEVRAMGKDGKQHLILTRGHNPELVCDHRIVFSRMLREGLVRTAKAGMVPLSLARVRPYLEAYERYYTLGLFRHYLESC